MSKEGFSRRWRRYGIPLEGTFSCWNLRKAPTKKYGPFKITKKINDNAYVVALPDSLHISNTFNVVDLYAYHEDDLPLEENSGSSSSEVEETDTDRLARQISEQKDRAKQKKPRAVRIYIR